MTDFSLSIHMTLIEISLFYLLRYCPPEGSSQDEFKIGWFVTLWGNDICNKKQIIVSVVGGEMITF